VLRAAQPTKLKPIRPDPPKLTAHWRHDTGRCFGSKTGIAVGPNYFRSAPKNGHWHASSVCPL